MNLQVISGPDGQIVWVSGPLPGAVHDLTAARIWGIIAELAASGLVVLADKGYTGAGDHVRVPYKGTNKPDSQKDANRAHARLRGPGERANAQLKSWHIMRKLRCLWRAGQLAKAIHVLQAANSGDERFTGVLLVTMDRPEAYHAADKQMHGELARVRADVLAGPGRRVAVITWAGKASPRRLPGHDQADGRQLRPRRLGLAAVTRS